MDPDGFRLLDLNDLLEQSQLAADDSKRLTGALARLVRLSLANATTGGVTLTADDLASFSTLLDCAHERAAKTHDAAVAVAHARLQGVR